MRWPRGERNLDSNELRFRLVGEVEGLEGGLEDMTRSRRLLHSHKTARRERKGKAEAMEEAG